MAKPPIDSGHHEQAGLPAASSGPRLLRGDSAPRSILKRAKPATPVLKRETGVAAPQPSLPLPNKGWRSSSRTPSCPWDNRRGHSRCLPLTPTHRAKMGIDSHSPPTPPPEMAPPKRVSSAENVIKHHSRVASGVCNAFHLGYFAPFDPNRQNCRAGFQFRSRSFPSAPSGIDDAVDEKHPWRPR